jgi:hypothetical protein
VVRACDEKARGQKKRFVKLKLKVDTDTRKGRSNTRTSPAWIETRHHAPQINGACDDDRKTGAKTLSSNNKYMMLQRLVLCSAKCERR